MIREFRHIGSDRIETVKIPIDGAISTEEIAALEKEHGTVYEHYIVLYHPRIPQDEAERYKAAIENLSKLDLSTALKADLVSAISATTETISTEPVITEGITPKEITNEPLIKGVEP